MADQKQTSSDKEKRPLLASSTETDPGPSVPISAIGLMILLNFLGSMGFSIVLPSLWPFIKSLGGVETLTGWAVAVNSAGTLLSSPIFGYWSDKRNFGEVLAVSLAIGVVANVTYAVSYANWMLLSARFLVGFGNGNNSILNSYLAYATRKENRTLVYAVNSASGVLGFILGPAVAAIATLKVFQYDIHIGKGLIEVNELRSPGYLSAAMLFLCIILLMVFFKEVRRPTTRQKSALEDGKFIPQDLDAIPLLAVIALIFFNFSFTAVFTILETIGTPYTTEYFHWSVADNSWMWTGIALAAVAVIFGLQVIIHNFMSHMHYERILLMVAQVVLVCATALLAENSFYEKPQLWKFLTGIGIGTLGYSMTTVLTISLFSKLLEGHEQGTWMGIFNASGGLARVVAPILGAYAFKYSGGKWVFVPSFAVAVVSFISNIFFWKRLVPRVPVVDVEIVTPGGDVNVRINE